MGTVLTVTTDAAVDAAVEAAERVLGIRKKFGPVRDAEFAADLAAAVVRAVRPIIEAELRERIAQDFERRADLSDGTGHTTNLWVADMIRLWKDNT